MTTAAGRSRAFSPKAAVQQAPTQAAMRPPAESPQCEYPEVSTASSSEWSKIKRTARARSSQAVYAPGR